MIPNGTKVWAFICTFAPNKSHKMNKILFFISVFVISVISSCSHEYPVAAELERADSLCLVRPRAAITLLDSLDLFVQNTDEGILRWWQLLTIKARDKADLPMASDSLIKVIVEFFDKNGPIDLQIEAHYYLARSYVELHDYPRAIVEFRKVIDISEENEMPDPHTMANACSQLSFILRRQEDNHAALEVVKKGYRVAQDYGFMDPIYVMDVATCFMRVHDFASLHDYYQKALKMMRDGKCVKDYSELIPEILGYYAGSGNRKQAYDCLQMLDSLPIENRPQDYDLGKASYFEFFGPIDSAIYYYKKYSILFDGYVRHRDTSRALMELYRRKGDYAEATRYAMIYAEASDSVRSQLRVEQTRDANNEYQYRRDMEAEAKAYRDASEARFDRTIAIGTAVIVLLFITALYLYRMRVAEQRLRSREQVILQHIEAIRQRDADIRTKEATISEKELEVERLIRHLLSSTAKEQSPDIISHFLNIAAGRERIKNEREWDELAAAIESLYPQFITRVHERWALIKADELQIVCLMKIGLDTPQVMNVTELPKTTVYRKVRKAKAMLGDLLMD